MDDLGLRDACCATHQGTIGGVIKSVHPSGPNLEEFGVGIAFHIIDDDAIGRREVPDLSDPGTGSLGLIDFIDTPVIGVTKAQILCQRKDAAVAATAELG